MKKNYSLLCLIALLVLGLSSLQTLSAQAIDSSFAPPQVFRPALVRQMVPAANGKVYVVGEISHSGDTKVARVVRLTPSGFLDASFKAQLPEKEVDFIEVLPNGNVIVITMEGIADTYFEIYVLASNGKLLKFIEPPVGYISSVKALPDNRFLVGGSNTIVRYTKNFNLDPTFKSLSYTNAPIDDIQLQGDNIIICGDFDNLGEGDELYDIPSVARLHSDGSIDHSFNIGMDIGMPAKMIVAPDHRIYPLGYLETNAFRLSADGVIDSSFHYPDYPMDVLLQDGKFTVCGASRITRISEEGIVDSTFSPIAVTPQSKIVLNADKSLLVGNYTNVRYGIARFSSAGVFTDTYKAQLLRKGDIANVKAQGQAAPILISGDFVKVNSLLTYNVARLKHDGSVDAGFSVTENYGPVHDIAYTGSGTVVVAAAQKLFRTTSKGKLDPTFAYTPVTDAPITKVLLQRDGKLIVGGSTVPGVYRLHLNGAQDSTFDIGTGPCCPHPYYDLGYGFDLDKNTGKIVFTGYFDTFNGYAAKGVVRLNSDGSVDTTYNTGSGTTVYSAVENVRMLSNGSVLLSGYYINYDGTAINHDFLRVNPDGSLNTTFNQNMASLPLYSPSVVELFHDRILVAENEFYSGFRQSALTITGANDPAFQFPTGVNIVNLNGYYSNNSTELYAFGTIISDGATQSLIRFQYADPSARIAGVSKTENALARKNDETKISFYPNPAKNIVNIEAGVDARVVIYDWAGKTSLSKTIGSGEEQIDISSLPRGRYILAITKGNRTERQHFMKD